MSDNYSSSDEIKSIENRQLGANIIERTVFITSLSQIGSSAYYLGTAEIDLADLNLNTLVPEFEAYMYSVLRLDGPEPGEYIYYNQHDKLPITKPVISGVTSNFGLIEEYARAYVYYESTGGIKEGVENGTSKLKIEYVLRGYSGGGISKRFDVKIKGSDAITADA